MDKLKELTLGEKIIAIAGVVLFLDSFLNWYSVHVTLFGHTVASASRNGWQEPDGFLSILAILIGLALAAAVIVPKITSAELPDRLGNLGWGVAELIAGGVAFAFVVIKWLGNTSYTAIGLYIGLLCTAALAVGGYLNAKEKGELPSSMGGTTSA